MVTMQSGWTRVPGHPLTKSTALVQKGGIVFNMRNDCSRCCARGATRPYGCAECRARYFPDAECRGRIWHGTDYVRACDRDATLQASITTLEGMLCNQRCDACVALAVHAGMLRNRRPPRSASAAAAAAADAEVATLCCSACGACFHIDDDAAMPPLPARYWEPGWTCTGCADAQALTRSCDISLQAGYAAIDAEREAAAPPSMTPEDEGGEFSFMYRYILRESC